MVISFLLVTELHHDLKQLDPCYRVKSGSWINDSDEMATNTT